MLFAIEGPDCAGKTTMFEQLKRELSGVRFVRFYSPQPISRECFRCVEAAHLQLLDALWTDQTIVSDRFGSITSLVYDEMNGIINDVDYSRWHERVVPVFLDPGDEELRRRLAVRKDLLYDEAKILRAAALYREFRVECPYRYMLNPSVQELRARIMRDR